MIEQSKARQSRLRKTLATAVYIPQAKRKIERDLERLRRLHRPKRGFFRKAWYGVRRGFIYLREGARIYARARYGIPL